MSRMQEMVAGVIEVFEENGRLKAELARLKAAREAAVEGGGATAETSPADAYIYAEGRKAVFGRCFCGWRSEVKVGDDGVPTPYGAWARNVLSTVPDCMSLDQLVEAFDPELHERYSCELRKAVEDPE